MATVLICEARHTARDGLTRLMSVVAGVHRIESVAGGEELLAHYTAHPADLVVIGTQRTVATGVHATYQLLGRHPQANVLVFGPGDDSGGIALTIAAGARGYLRWDTARPELVAVLAHALIARAARTSAAHHSVLPTPTRTRAGDSPLSERELQVLALMSRGKTNSQIGGELFLAHDTVKTHARRIFRKLGVKDRAEAVAYGLRRGYVT